jgi:hypothetical protein
VLFCQGYNSNFVLLAEGGARDYGELTCHQHPCHASLSALTGEKRGYNLYYLSLLPRTDIGVPYEKIEME